MNNAPISSPHSNSPISEPNLDCPYCGHSLNFSWRQYWLAPTGRHKCLKCGEKSKLRLSLALRVLTHILGVLLPIPTAFIFSLFIPFLSDKAWLLWFAGYLVLSLLLDKYFERKYGVLCKIR